MENLFDSQSAVYKFIKKRLKKRKLVWFGTRGTDSNSLTRFEEFKDVFSIIAPLHSLSLSNEICLETEKGTRVDLDNYRIENDTSPEAQELHSKFYAALSEPSFLVTYRPAKFLSSIYFPRYNYDDDRVRYLGQFHEFQASFEHKPWVETELYSCGIPVIRWEYFGDDGLNLLKDRLKEGPKVIRANISDGGIGLSLINTPDDFREDWFSQRFNFFGVADYMVPNIPLNVNACIFRNKVVTLHPASFQLIGIPTLSNRKFGYCGNDFAQIKSLDNKILDELEDVVVRAGKWMASKGYLGVFGVDALFYDGKIVITEINPRFQGSSDLAARIDSDLGRPDMFMMHIAAFLGAEPSESTMRLRDLVKSQMEISHAICHNVNDSSLERNITTINPTGQTHYELVPVKNTLVEPEAILFRTVTRGSMTDDGGSLRKPFTYLIKDAIRKMYKTSFKAS